MALNPNQSIIVQAFGLTSVQVAIASASIAASEVAGEAQGYTPNPYIGAIPLQANPADAPAGTSPLGTPVFGGLTIKGGSYFDTNLGQTVTYSDFTINDVLMTITQTNNVVLTNIQGRDGEVIEYVGKQSFRINFKGGFFSTGNVRPQSQIALFKNIVQSNQEIVVSSPFLLDWDISEIVIVDKTLPQVAGGYNYQLFEFNAIQNTPIILAQQQNVA